MPEEKGHTIAEHVDDVCQLTIHEREQTAAIIAMRQGVQLAQGLCDADLKISDKSVVLSNKPKVGARVAQHLQRHGFAARHVLSAEDLGITTRGGHVRTAKSLNGRLKKAAARARRVGIFCQKT